jgi:hypothetical protein
MKLACRTQSSLKAESQARDANDRRKNDSCPPKRLRSRADIAHGDDSSCYKIKGE